MIGIRAMVALVLLAALSPFAAMAAGDPALQADRAPAPASPPFPLAALPALGAGAIDLDAQNAEDAVSLERAESAAQSAAELKLLGDAEGAIDLAALDRLPARRGGYQWECLAKTIYFEARGESVAGQVAVAEVVLNRVDSRHWPNDICSVVRQGERQRHRCQFSFMCDGLPERITDRESFAVAGKIAHLMMQGRPRALTGAATHYHAAYVRPGWSRGLTRTARIGQHVFYRFPTRVAAR